MMLRGIRHLVFHDILWVSWCHPILGFTETLVKQCKERKYHEPEVKRGLMNGWRWVEEAHTKAGWEQPLQFLGLEVDRKEGNKREEALQWWSGRESESVKTRKGSGKKKGELRCTTRQTMPLVSGWTPQYMHVHFCERRLGSLWWLTALYRRPFPTMETSYLVLFKGTFLFHVRAVLSRHHGFDICHRHCNS